MYRGPTPTPGTGFQLLPLYRCPPQWHLDDTAKSSYTCLNLFTASHCLQNQVKFLSPAQKILLSWLCPLLQPHLLPPGPHLPTQFTFISYKIFRASNTQLYVSTWGLCAFFPLFWILLPKTLDKPRISYNSVLRDHLPSPPLVSEICTLKHIIKSTASCSVYVCLLSWTLSFTFVPLALLWTRWSWMLSHTWHAQCLENSLVHLLKESISETLE